MNALLLKNKIRLGFLIVLALAVISLVGWLVFGLAAPMVENWNTQKYVKTTHGLADTASEIDPHITKVDNEHSALIEFATPKKPLGVYERKHAGDYSYEALAPELPGRYTIETTIILNTPEEATSVYEEMVTYLKEIGYIVPADATQSEMNIVLTRMFNAAEETSQGSPGDDKITITNAPSGDKGRLILFYVSPETPLGGIPSNNEENITVKEYDKMWEQITSGEKSLCGVEPNGATGGWYSEYECQQEYL